MSLASRVTARHQSQGLAFRVASRYIEAFEFDTEKERSKYLKEHPGADPSRHTVKKQVKKPGKGVPPPKPGKPSAPPVAEKPQPPARQAPEWKKSPHKEEPEQDEKRPEEEAAPEKTPDVRTPGKKFVESLKGLSKGAVSLLKKAPEGVKKFFQDDAHRRTVLMRLHGAIGKAPGEMARRLITTAKSEVHEFKLASEGVRAAMEGKGLSRHQKHAIKAVTIHMGITTAAAALSVTSLAAGLAFAAKAIARHIALKSVHRTFDHLHTASELHHIGHGVMELMGKFSSEDGQDPDQILAAIVMKSVQEELANLSEEDLRTILEQMANSGSGMVREAAVSPGVELAELCEQAETIHKGLRTQIREFPKVLKESVQIDSQSLVWQEPWVIYWGKMGAPLEALLSIDDAIEGIYLNSIKSSLQTLANVARDATSDRLIPQKARIEYAFGNPQFRDDRIAYSVERLKTWAHEFESWVENSIEILHQTARKARRSV